MAVFEGNMEVAFFALGPDSEPLGGASVDWPEAGTTFVTVQEATLDVTITGAPVGGAMNPEYPLLTGVVPEVIP